MKLIVPALAFLIGGCSGSNAPQHKSYDSSSDIPSPLTQIHSSRLMARTFALFKRLKYGMRDRAIVDIVGNADKTPQDLTVATYHLTDGSMVELYSDSYLFSAEHITKDGKRHTFIDDKQRIIAATARTLAPFKRLKVGMYHVDIDALVGKADTDGGPGLRVGIHNYGYKLSDGSLVYVAYGNELTSVRHQLKNGQMVDLIKSK